MISNHKNSLVVMLSLVSISLLLLAVTFKWLFVKTIPEQNVLIIINRSSKHKAHWPFVKGFKLISCHSCNTLY